MNGNRNGFFVGMLNFLLGEGKKRVFFEANIVESGSKTVNIDH